MAQTIITETQPWCTSLVEPTHIEHDEGLWKPELVGVFLIASTYRAVWKLGSFIGPTPAKEASQHRIGAAYFRRQGSLDSAWLCEERAWAAEHSYPYNDFRGVGL